jgi:alpha-galactosidase
LLQAVVERYRKKMKLTLVGAGSPTFTPFLFKRILQGSLPSNPIEVALMDVDLKALKQMGIVIEKIYSSFRKQNKNLDVKITKHVNLAEALDASNFVITTVGVGGFRATSADIDIPARFGIFQSIGDTVGPGGIFRGLRHIPVVLKVAKTMEDVCPSAYLFNYTNPMTPITRAVNRETKIKAYGLCTSVWHTLNYLAKNLSVPPESLDMTIAGINHFCLITNLEYNGENLIDKIATNFPKRFGPVCREIYSLTGQIPYAGDRHTSEFFPNLYANGRATFKKYNLLPNMLTVLDLKDRAPVEKMIREIATGKQKDAEKLLSVPGWEEEGIGVVSIMESLTCGKEMTFAGINIPNNGMIDNLPEGAIVEVPAKINGSGILPRKIGSRLPQDMAAVMAQRITQYELLVDAALTGDRNTLLRSMQLDGYIKSQDQGRRLLGQILKAEKRWFPEYWFPNAA